MGGNTTTDAEGSAFNDLAHRNGFTIAQVRDVTLLAIGNNSMTLTTSTITSQLQALHATAHAALSTDPIILWTTIFPSSSSDRGLYPVGSAKLMQVSVGRRLSRVQSNQCGRQSRYDQRGDRRRDRIAVRFRIIHSDERSAPVRLQQYGAVLGVGSGGFNRSAYTSAEAGLLVRQTAPLSPRIFRTYARAQQVSLTNALPSVGVRFAGISRS